MKDKRLGGEKESHSEGDLHFHYDRDERLQFASSDVRNRGKGPKGIFRNNRGLLILFIDILLIVMIGILFSVFGSIFGSSKSYGGYELKIEGFEYNEEVYARLKVTAKRDAAELENNLIEGEFIYGDSDQRIEIAEILPAEKGESRVIRAIFTKEKGVKQVHAQVMFLDKEYKLKTDIEDE
jgi:hypothetical protein